MTWDHDRAVCELTAVKWLCAHPGLDVAMPTAGSSQGVGGVCRVVRTGMGSESAKATGRWWRLLLWTMSTSSRRRSDNITWR